MNPENLLGLAIGTWLAQSKRLRAAYLPEGVDRSIAVSIVRAANAAKGLPMEGEAPYCVLVDSSKGDADDEFVTVAVSDTVQFRQEERLLVVLGRQPELASVRGSYLELLGKSFPAGVAREALQPLAEHLVAATLSTIGVTHSLDRTVVNVMVDTLVDARSAHEVAPQGSKPWNAYWFDHVSIALENIASTIRQAEMDEPERDIAKSLIEWIPASFGLPKRGLGTEKQTPFQPKKFKEAMEKYWSDEENVKITVQLLAHHPDTTGESHTLSGLDWSGFDQTLASEDNILIALAKHSYQLARATLAFSELTYRQFLDPGFEASLSENIRLFPVTAVDDRGLSISESPEAGPDLVEMITLRSDERPHRLQSQPLRIRIPTRSAVTPAMASTSKLQVRLSLRSLSWIGGLMAEDGELWAVGIFAQDIKRFPHKIPSKPFSVSVTALSNDVLTGLVDLSKSRRVLLAVTEVPGIWAQRLDSHDSPVGKIEYVGPDSMAADGDADDKDVSWTTDQDETNHRLLLWGTESPPEMPDGADKAVSYSTRERVFTSTLKISDLDEIDIGNCHFELRSVESTSTDFSPLVAAINGNRISTDAAKPSMITSIAGKYEEMLGVRLSSAAWMQGMGHVVMPIDRDEASVRDATWSEAHNLLMPKALMQAWTGVFGGEVQEELLRSAEAESFRNAFLALDVASVLGAAESDDPTLAKWPSRISWSHLWRGRREALDRYLATHTNLIMKAKQLGDPFGIFWAAYPFSVSGWSTTDSAECMAVYLSPLHPVRLAWLASVESTLLEATNPGNLAGQIEGWKFPYTGPCGTEQGYCIAIPCDPGEEQVFTGWALMVRAQLQTPRPLQAPRRFGKDNLPGNAASGLNATSTATALRDFHRLQPHISTLTVDLASTVETQRLPEVDVAIVDAVESWTVGDDEKLPGGIRVLDSHNRTGDIPRLAASRLLEQSKTPFSWMRYEHDAGLTQRCNIRLLQDSGVAVFAGNSEQGPESNRGLAGSVPLRRFEIYDSGSQSIGQSISTPALRLEKSQPSAFQNCLAALEGPASGPRIVAKIQNTVLVDPRADWTVSGEAMLTPSAMSSLIQKHGRGGQMLWEWRPPFFGFDRKVPPLARRPFISIARVPSSFSEHLTKMLSVAKGSEVEATAAGDLMSVLGSRGIGLSSLLSMGGTHAAGALGFYLGIRLMDFVSSKNAEDFVLPLDACDTFLRSLSGSLGSPTRDQKADLLVLRITDEELILTPIEIKFHGMNSENPAPLLPGPESGKFNEATKQLSSTLKLLNSLAIRHEAACSDPDSPDAALWSNTLATLVETGMKLSPSPAGRLDVQAARFRAVLDGKIRLRVGKPLVAYFAHDAQTQEAEDLACYTGIVSTHDTKDPFRFGAYVANARGAFRAAEGLDSAATEAWQSLLDWANEPDTGGSESASPGTTVGPDAPSDQTPPTYEPDAAHQPKSSQRSGSAQDISDQKNTENPSSTASMPSAAGGASGLEPSLPPLRGDGIRITVGRIINSIGDAAADYWPSNTDLNQLNIGVVGDLGTGKTQLLKSLIYQLRRRAASSGNPPLSFLIFDYKKDFQDLDFLKSIGGQLLLPHRIPLNLFVLSGDYNRQSAYKAANRFGNILARIYGGIGPKQLQRLNDVVLDLFEANRGAAPTLGQVYDAYLASAASADALSAILQSFYYNEVFSENQDELETFSDLINNKVLVLGLDSFGTDQQMKNSLVAVFLNMYYDYMLQSEKWPYQGSDPQLRRLNSFLLVDEAVNIMAYKFPVLQQLLLQGREFGFGVILATQYLSHFKHSEVNYGQPLLTWFIHKVPDIKVAELHQLGLTHLGESEAAHIPKLKQHQALYSSHGYDGRFILGTPYYKLVSARFGDQGSEAEGSDLPTDEERSD